MIPMLPSTTILAFAGFLGGLATGSLVEHAIHRYFLHGTPEIFKRVAYVKSMWRGHALAHHGRYAPNGRCGHYAQDETNRDAVLAFSWWEGPLLIMLCAIGSFGIAAGARSLLGLEFRPFMPEAIGAVAAFVIYYAAYEGLHAIMHVPRRWPRLRSARIVTWLNRRHYQHHINPRTNLNVLIPIADYIWGTERPLPAERQAAADAGYRGD